MVHCDNVITIIVVVNDSPSVSVARSKSIFTLLVADPAKLTIDDHMFSSGSTRHFLSSSKYLPVTYNSIQWFSATAADVHPTKQQISCSIKLLFAHVKLTRNYICIMYFYL